MEPSNQKVLPPNAYKELKPGEKYQPVVPAERIIEEITTRSVVFGVLMAIIFSFSAAYLGLKVGQVFEAAIPIAILAVGLSQLFTRKNTILENVIIQSIGAASGVVVAGGIFVIPAFYILGMEKNITLLDTFLAAFLGGCIGILFLIPLRRYFCAEEHGKLPFPEATATTEILATGEAGGAQARVLAFSMIIGGIYDFFADVLHAWNFHLNSKQIFGGFGTAMAEKFRMVFKLDALAAFFGLGYIIGLRYTAIIAAGSTLSFLVFVPAFYFIGQHLGSTVIPPGTIPIAQMDELQIFSVYVQKIGIGAIAMAGIIGILKFSKIIVSSFTIGFKEMFGGTHRVEAARTDRDISMKWILTLIALFIVLIGIFFIYLAGFKIGLVGLLIVILLAFVFTTVAAKAIAIVGINPVSGMTLLTLIVVSIVLSFLIPAGQETLGMIIALIMGCVVCTALAMAGGFITDLKIGYWLGATPRNQERWKFLGTIVAAACVSLAILIIHHAYGFTVIQEGMRIANPNVAAPQGNLMAAIIQSLMDPNQQQPWILYGLGGLIAILLEMCGVSPLVFGLGMYLPIQLNMPLLAGGIVSWLVMRSSKKEEVSTARKERGILIASGFIAGGALMGMLGAVLNLETLKRVILTRISIGATYEWDGALQKLMAQPRLFYDSWSHWLGLIFFILLGIFIYYYSKAAAKE